MVRAALEAEKRLYESALAAVDQTFAKETLVVTFLTTGALVAVTSGFQACAPILIDIPVSRAILPFGCPVVSAVSVIVGSSLAIWMVRGHKVQDLESGESLLRLNPLPETPDEVGRQMIVEYARAREAHVVLVASRVKHLRGVLRVLVVAIAFALAGVLIAIGASLGNKAAARPQSAYTSDMKPNPHPESLPKPAGNGTTLIKGGGGDGTDKPSESKTIPGPVGDGTKSIKGRFTR